MTETTNAALHPSNDPKSAGCRWFELPDPASGYTIRLAVLYPSSGPEAAAALGPYRLDLAMDGPLAKAEPTLVVISHGTGGSPLVFRSLAVFLARAGYVVAMPEHPGNTLRANELEGTVANLELRPRHVRRIIDWASRESPFAAMLDSRVVVVGHSMGGYTALALAGAHVYAGPHETPDGVGKRIEVVADDRVSGIVLLAPAAPWFQPNGALADVHVPVLMLTAEHDEDTPAWHGDVITRGLPEATPLDHRVVENAGHFAFLTPFPESITSELFRPSQDLPGFDRPRFLEEMNAAILTFVERV